MFRRMRCFIGLDPESPLPKRSASSKPLSRRRREIRFHQHDMLETVHEIANYIHRFYNLDLFQQGLFQIKISVRWEDSAREVKGIPSRVVQYEAPNLASDGTLGVWKIDDSEQSFSTQPFKIKYAREDVLSVMVSFNLNLGCDEKPSTSAVIPLPKKTSAVILKFELMHAPLLESGAETQVSFDAFPAAIHEFRVPPKALLGLHSYCPVHFDAFHAVLVDMSVHAVFLKLVPTQLHRSNSHMMGTTDKEHHEEPNQILGEGFGSKAIELVKALLISREILLEELEKISNAIGQTIEDLVDADLNLGRLDLVGPSLKPDLSTATRGFSGKKKGVGQLAGILTNILEKSDGTVDVGNDVVLYSLSMEEILDVFISVGSQLSFIWNVFLKFHRMDTFLTTQPELSYARHQPLTSRRRHRCSWKCSTTVLIRFVLPHPSNEHSCAVT